MDVKKAEELSHEKIRCFVRKLKWLHFITGCYYICIIIASFFACKKNADLSSCIVLALVVINGSLLLVKFIFLKTQKFIDFNMLLKEEQMQHIKKEQP